ncbi:MAG: hypothetical protein ACK4M9_11975 [Anaerobacillus sp.]|uniref:hypothetical protein n=1 Tax=Anaerobacillus sp. TaxID=1872506 RepID=UPI00391D1270
MSNDFYNVKLTDKDVYRMLYLNKVEGKLPYQLEEQFPVSRTTIKNIVNGKSRKDCYHAFMTLKTRQPNKLKEVFKELSA